MDNSVKKIEVQLTRVFKLEDHTFEFFSNKDDFTSKYAIVKIEDELYGLVERTGTYEIVIFKDITKFGERLYLLKLENEKSVLVLFTPENNILFSMQFDEIIKEDDGCFFVSNGSKNLFIIVTQDCIYDSSCNYDMYKYDGRDYCITREGLISPDVYFDDFEVIGDETILLKWGKRRYLLKVQFYKDGELKFFISEEFNQVIKIFAKYILIEDFEGNRQLLSYNKNRIVEWKDLVKDVNYNNAVIDLPNGKKTILTKELNYADVEFDSIGYEYYTKESDNKFRIITFNNDKKETAVIRISDLKVSERFKCICRKSISYHCKASIDYLCVSSYDSKKVAFMRVDDFEVSNFYENIMLAGRGYALVVNEEKTDVMRLKDYSIARWPEDIEN